MTDPNDSTQPCPQDVCPLCSDFIPNSGFVPRIRPTTVRQLVCTNFCSCEYGMFLGHQYVNYWYNGDGSFCVCDECQNIIDSPTVQRNMHLLNVFDFFCGIECNPNCEICNMVV